MLLEVVSDKTGYPPEMLSMEMELEGDLGIDSIKRVEILSSMNDLAPGLPEVDTAVMAKLVTLGQVVDYMNEQLGDARSEQVVANDAPDTAETETPQTLGDELGRFVLEAVEKPARGLAQSGVYGRGPGGSAASTDGTLSLLAAVSSAPRARSARAGVRLDRRSVPPFGASGFT